MLRVIRQLPNAIIHPMKLLLTGLPGTGKTTVIQSLIRHHKNAFWVISAEIPDNEGRRIGFSAETSTGVSGIFAHKHTVESPVQIGDYKVDVRLLDRLFTAPIQAATQTGQLLIIDEIGRMQMLSSDFEHTIRQLFTGNCSVVATIRYGDQWTKEFTDRRDTLTLVLTHENRDLVQNVVETIVSAEPALRSLAHPQQAAIVQLARQYAANNHFIQLKKLYKNAVPYLSGQKVRQTSDHAFEVEGNHHSHDVTLSNSQWACDCDLFHGRNQFSGKAGECSHIQATQLYLTR